MSRKPSLVTEVKTLRRQLKETQAERDGSQVRMIDYRTRATKAETEAADWRKRFDQLLFNASKVALNLVDARSQAKPEADHG